MESDYYFDISHRNQSFVKNVILFNFRCPQIINILSVISLFLNKPYTQVQRCTFQLVFTMGGMFQPGWQNTFSIIFINLHNLNNFSHIHYDRVLQCPILPTFGCKTRVLPKPVSLFLCHAVCFQASLYFLRVYFIHIVLWCLPTLISGPHTKKEKLQPNDCSCTVSIQSIFVTG